MRNKIIQNKTYHSETSATGGLFHHEINALLPLILSPKSEELLAKEVRENNVIQINAQSTRSKVIGEIKKRISAAFEGFWDDYTTAPPHEQALMLFFLILKTKPLFYTFHFEVTIPAWKGSARKFEAYNYQMKIDDIGNEHENVRRFTESTREQILKIYRRMLKESGLLKDNHFNKPDVPEDFFFRFIKTRDVWFLDACFLTPAEKERIINNNKLAGQ